MNLTQKKVLVIGAFGQLGQELATKLAELHGDNSIILADIRMQSSKFECLELDVLDKKKLLEIVQKYKINVIYHLAALLSATGEREPNLAWEINMQGLLNVLEISVKEGVEQVFWPSSIAVFGPNTPSVNTPQLCVMDPTTMYGITKLAGERLCEYYYFRYGLDVRSLRYPGLISYAQAPGGGTTDYAVHIFIEALKKGNYACFLKPETRLPMMYMQDAINATIQLMQAKPEALTVRSSYNLAAISFTPKELALAIQQKKPEFLCEYIPDFRQSIADSWPKSIDDTVARKDWNWAHKFGFQELVDEMWNGLSALIRNGAV